MGRVTGFMGLLIALAIGAYLYTQQAKSSSPGGLPPTTAINVTGVKNDLISIAKAEQRRMASDGKYVSLDDLRSNGDISMPSNSRAGYTYSVETSENGFHVIATYSGADEHAPRSLTIDQSMQITQ